MIRAPETRGEGGRHEGNYKKTFGALILISVDGSRFNLRKKGLQILSIE